MHSAVKVCVHNDGCINIIRQFIFHQVMCATLYAFSNSRCVPPRHSPLWVMVDKWVICFHVWLMVVECLWDVVLGSLASTSLTTCTASASTQYALGTCLMATDLKVFELFCRVFFVLLDCWFFKERGVCPWSPCVCRLLSFSMFLLFHVCDCNTPLVTHFKVQIKQVIQLEMVRFFGRKEVIAPMHAPELHGTALLQPCILLNAPECTFAEQSVNEHKMSVDTQCVLWSGQIVDLNIAHVVVYGTVVGGFSCFYLLIRIFLCLFCFVTLRWSDAL